LHAASTSTAKREVDAYLAERNKYKQRSEQKVKKGSEREAETLKMLATFQSKMERSRKLAAYVSAGVADDVDEDEDGDEKEADNDDDDDDTNDLSWSVRALCIDCFFQLLWPPYVIGQAIIFLPCGFFLLSSSFFSSPNLNGRRLDVYHTLTHGVALVRI